jgi:hypothetical protein
MMKLSGSVHTGMMACVLLAGSACAQPPEEVRLNCSNFEATAGEELKRGSCAVDSDGTLSATFGWHATQSPHATALDERRVVVVVADSGGRALSALRRGCRPDNEVGLVDCQLAFAPMDDLVTSRQSVDAPVKLGAWTITQERVSYGAQGGAVGFQMDCATAIGPRKSRTVAIFECFPLEQRKRFLSMVDAALK